jgi:protein-S-isoprenylcysteine O-methyltransferase Ste14
LTQPQHIVRLGGWLFRHRTSLPVPLALLLLLVPADGPPAAGPAAGGAALVAAGESLRLWGVRHIGTISRTRTERLGPLIETGPFALVRNPLYIGNIALWAGFAIAARLYWLAPLVVLVLAFEYHAIVRWEEQLLEGRVGETYREYAARVPRWLPRSRRSRVASLERPAPFAWSETVYSERGTLVAIAIGCALLYGKGQLGW